MGRIAETIPGLFVRVTPSQAILFTLEISIPLNERVEEETDHHENRKPEENIEQAEVPDQFRDAVPHRRSNTML